MAEPRYERLSAVDAALLRLEEHNAHMHVGAVAIFAAAPLRNADGALDVEQLQRALESTLHRTPRLRQRLAFVPLIDHPVWVDDDRFNLHYHVRHTALPPPGDERQLKRLAGRIVSQQLDRRKPLWETWFVEGLAGDRFAMIVKAHHCMVDGVAGIGALAAMMRADQQRTDEPAPAWQPRPHPDGVALVRDELAHRASSPAALLRAGLRALRSPERALASLRESAESLGEMLGAGLSRGSDTPLNVAVGPHRRFDWVRLDLADLSEVRKRLGGTLNDIVLTCVSGAIGRFLERRGLRPDELAFRSMVPVNIRHGNEAGAMGNRVTFLVADLPVAERDPRRRLERVVEITRKLKRSKQVAGMDLLERVSDQVMPWLFEEFARLGYSQRAYNMVVTNVPGPRVPLYMEGAPLQEIYPVVPIFAKQALNIGLFSYHGGLYWGFNADWDALPDLHEVVEDAALEFRALYEAACSPR
ncbi:MAG: wax ester/triacylglycerol synthase family O-acyltransferase [Myxococcota bacterium]|nr:wax ester/triacylglycerol synthase family O-acyltransferase [Myxococcota bacterium]